MKQRRLRRAVRAEERFQKINRGIEVPVLHHRPLRHGGNQISPPQDVVGVSGQGDLQPILAQRCRLTLHRHGNVGHGLQIADAEIFRTGDLTPCDLAVLCRHHHRSRRTEDQAHDKNP